MDTVFSVELTFRMLTGACEGEGEGKGAGII